MISQRVPAPAPAPARQQRECAETAAELAIIGDDRVFVEVIRGVEWLCSPAALGWRTTAAGYNGPIDTPHQR